MFLMSVPWTGFPCPFHLRRHLTLSYWSSPVLLIPLSSIFTMTDTPVPPKSDWIGLQMSSSPLTGLPLLSRSTKIVFLLTPFLSHHKFVPTEVHTDSSLIEINWEGSECLGQVRCGLFVYWSLFWDVCQSLVEGQGIKIRLKTEIHLLPDSPGETFTKNVGPSNHTFPLFLTN